MTPALPISLASDRNLGRRNVSAAEQRVRRVSSVRETRAIGHDDSPSRRAHDLVVGQLTEYGADLGALRDSGESSEALLLYRYYQSPPFAGPGDIIDEHI